MRISILCSEKTHPIRDTLDDWIERSKAGHDVELASKAAELAGGDLLFLIACHEIVGPGTRNRFRKTLVIHSSDIPEGRGWSPQVWAIIEGRDEITVSLLEADDAVDSGRIWAKRRVKIADHELYDEINEKLFRAWIELMDFAVANFETVEPCPQDSAQATYYRHRRPQDSQIDPSRSISEQFDALRIADPNRYPAFFHLRGHRYEILLRKADET